MQVIWVLAIVDFLQQMISTILNWLFYRDEEGCYAALGCATKPAYKEYKALYILI